MLGQRRSVVVGTRSQALDAEEEVEEVDDMDTARGLDDEDACGLVFEFCCECVVLLGAESTSCGAKAEDVLDIVAKFANAFGTFMLSMGV
jgi:hypothetical protein